MGSRSGPLAFLRPFLAPLFAWAAAAGGRGTVALPWSVKFILTFLARELDGGGGTTRVQAAEQYLGEAFRTDAKAEGKVVTIGGWECRGGGGTREARWFSAELTKENAPWAFSRGEPFRTIAALELYATLVAVTVFTRDGPGINQKGKIKISGATDNLGNSFILPRLMSSKFPLVVVLAELAVQLRGMGLGVGLGMDAPRPNTNKHMH